MMIWNRMLLNVFTNGTAQSVQPAGYAIAGKRGLQKLKMILEIRINGSLATLQIW